MLLLYSCLLQFMLSVMLDFPKSDMKERHSYVNFDLEFKKTAAEKHEMLRMALSDIALGKTRTFERFFLTQTLDMQWKIQFRLSFRRSHR
jgi:hypothetical protein